MIDIKFEINGRRIDPRNIGDALEGAMLSAITQGLQKRVGACRCSVHGAAPKLIGKGRGIDKLNFEVSGCCEKLIADVKSKLGAA